MIVRIPGRSLALVALLLQAAVSLTAGAAPLSVRLVLHAEAGKPVPVEIRATPLVSEAQASSSREEAEPFRSRGSAPGAVELALAPEKLWQLPSTLPAIGRRR
jgi:hypothetical protein